MGAGRPADGITCLLERSPRRFERGQPAQPVAVALSGQVERPVRGIEIRLPTVTVGDAGHVDLAEDCLERPAMPGLGGAMGLAAGGHHRQAGLTQGTQVHLVGEHLAQQLAAPLVEARLEVRVLQGDRFVAAHPGEELLGQGSRHGEGLGGGSLS